MRPTWAVSLAELDADPHPVLARMRQRSPVCWVPSLGGWLVTGYRAAVEVLADPAAFTVDDPRFTTARVTGPSMLSSDGAEHTRHRAPFAHAFGPAALQGTLAGLIRAEAVRLARELRPRGSGELREDFAGPLAAAVMAAALGLAARGVTAETVLGWYRDIVAAVAALPASEGGAAERVPVASYGALAAALLEAMDHGHAPVLAAAADSGALTPAEAVSNAAVALFGGIETAEGMTCNAALYLLENYGMFRDGGADLDLDRGVEESLRLEPAAAVVDRYATRDVTVGGALIGRGDLVRVSIAGANRDPAEFPSPDQFDPARPNAGRHLAFARGPHFCIGAHLARLETVTAIRALLDALPGLRLDAGRPAHVRGLVFRKPPALHVVWDDAYLMPVVSGALSRSACPSPAPSCELALGGRSRNLTIAHAWACTTG